MSTISIGQQSNRSTRLQSADSFVPGLIAAGMLITFRHLSYAFVTLLPASAYLLLAEAAGAWRGRRWLFWGMQAGLVFDMPTFYRLAHAHGFVAGAAEVAFLNFDRGFMLMLFTVLFAVACRSSSSAHRRRRDRPGDVVVA